jgi:hypothetical protein
MDDDEKARWLRESEVMWIKQQTLMACPHAIMVPEHYRAEGTCRCNDPEHREMKAWGYKWDRNVKAWVDGA